MEQEDRLSVSRRNFLKGAAAGTLSIAALGGLSACGSGNSASSGSSDASSSAASSNAENVSTSGEYDVMSQFSGYARNENPEAVAAATPEEFIISKGDGLLSAGGMVGGLGIKPADFMLNTPAWLGSAPEITDIAGTESCDVLVIGAGNAGMTAALRCQEAGLTTFLAETQTYDEYDEYACDMACYNSKIFMDKGTPKIDPTEIFNEYMRMSRGHAHQKIVRDFAFRSGEMLDWMMGYIPDELIASYAKTSNYKGNENFPGEINNMKSFIGMTQWRDEKTNINMWPYVIRSVMDSFEDIGGEIKWGYQGIVLVKEGDAVRGAICKDIDGNYQQIDARAVIVCAGDFGGNPDMRLDLSDQMRNLAWSFGKDRTDVDTIGGLGRDGSGIKMCLWAGGTIEAGPRAGQAAGINDVPGMAFGGTFPCFGSDGKRFMNEAIVKHGSNGYLDMLAPDQLLLNVTDANWEDYLSYQGYGHETMDRSSDYMVEEVRENMEEYVTGADGFPVRAFSRFGIEYTTMYAADTLEEVAEIAGLSGEAVDNFVAEVARYNEFCEAGHDDDWGTDPNNLFPIKTPPFFFNFGTTGGNPSGGLCQHAAICTDGNYRVLTGDKTPIEGLYAGGNTCGQRYGIQYSTPTAGNSCGSALTSGFCAADAIIEALS